MPHLASFRKGWESENLARFILSKFAFIANPSTVADDVGSDYMCTLFRIKTIDKHDYLIPKNSFAIQIKSNKENFDFTNQLDFLFNVEIPFFVGVSNRSELKMTIYSGECIPAFFALVGYPKNLEIKLCDRKEIHPAGYFERYKGDKYVLKFPKLVEVKANIHKKELKKKVDTLCDACSFIQKNIASRKSQEYIFDMYGYPTIVEIMAGRGSASVFRVNFFKRLAEVFSNLKWIKENAQRNFDEEEFRMYERLYEELNAYYETLPHYLRSSVDSLRGLLLMSK